MNRPLRVIVWNEFRVERSNREVAAISPDGIHEVLAAPLRAAGHAVRLATLPLARHSFH